MGSYYWFPWQLKSFVMLESKDDGRPSCSGALGLLLLPLEDLGGNWRRPSSDVID